MTRGGLTSSAHDSDVGARDQDIFQLGVGAGRLQLCRVEVQVHLALAAGRKNERIEGTERAMFEASSATNNSAKREVGGVFYSTSRGAPSRTTMVHEPMDGGFGTRRPSLEIDYSNYPALNPAYFCLSVKVCSLG